MCGGKPPICLRIRFYFQCWALKGIYHYWTYCGWTNSISHHFENMFVGIYSGVIRNRWVSNGWCVISTIHSQGDTNPLLRSRCLSQLPHPAPGSPLHLLLHLPHLAFLAPLGQSQCSSLCLFQAPFGPEAKSQSKPCVRAPRL